MTKRIRKQLQFLLVFVVALGGVGLVLATLATADDADTTYTAQDVSTLDRHTDPVIVAGGAVTALVGVPIDELFAYAYGEGAWQQIPFQVDEVTSAGAFTTTEDSLLDGNDEVVFMAMDVGDQAPAVALVTTTLPISDTWYEIAVNDPLSPARQGWVYLFRSTVLTSTAGSDYVDFDSDLHHINGTSYSLGFGTTHPVFESLTLDGGVDILDRTKIRMYGALPWLVLTEETIGPLPDDLIKDGPVRVIVRGGNGLAYGSVVWWKIPIPRLIPGFKKAIRFSNDFSEEASGSILYNAAVTEGVTVDGINEAVPTVPLSPWWQLNNEHGTLVQVGDSSSMGGEQTNYYLDDLAVDPDDTGDGRSYGDIGIRVEDPLETFTYTFALHRVPMTQVNLGEVYYDRFRNPLTAATSRQDRFSVALTAAPDSLIVGGSATLTATVLDLLERPVSETLVAFSIVSGQGTITPAVVPTDGDGEATASLSSQLVGHVIVKASVDSVDSNAETISFTAGGVTTVTLETTPDRLIVGRTSKLTATTLDQYGNPISGAVVSFTVVSGQGTLTPTVAATDEAGQAMASLSSDTAGDVTVRATADNVASGSKTVTYLHAVYLPMVVRDDSG
jgi:hypothetical protein